MSTIGSRIDSYVALRDKKRELDKQSKELGEEMRELEHELIQALDAENTTKGAGKLASVSLNEAVYPSVDDWDAFYAYLHKNKYYHLLERRPAVAACRELFEMKGKIPGVLPFTKKQLRITPLK